MRCLVTGATGYVGGRLVPQLLERGYDVRVMVRDNTVVAQERDIAEFVPDPPEGLIG